VVKPTFTKIDSIDPVVEYLVKSLTNRLEHGRVLWLVSGGSAVAIETAIAKRLSKAKLTNLTVCPTDERLGPVGHPDSNWFQLMRSGFVLPGASLRPILTGIGSQDDAENFAHFLERALSENDYKVGLFGIGPDGHTAGIPARHAEILSGLATLYEAGTFQRISMTPAAIGRLDEAIVYAFGQAKWPVLDKFKPETSPGDMSAVALFRASKLTVFSDRLGDKA
jgi:6-phosphogluconolactonase/glucosamine-6-phosphate isomerase/deaminase